MKKLGYFLSGFVFLSLPYGAFQLLRDPVEQKNLCLAVRQPRQVVAAYLRDPEKLRLWISGLEKVKVLPGRKSRDLARYELLVDTASSVVTLSWILQDPAGKGGLNGTLTHPHLESTFSCQFSESPGVTRLLIRQETRYRSRFGKLASPLLSLMVQRRIWSDLDRLKALAEAG